MPIASSSDHDEHVDDAPTKIASESPLSPVAKSSGNSIVQLKLSDDREISLAQIDRVFQHISDLENVTICFAGDLNSNGGDVVFGNQTKTEWNIELKLRFHFQLSDDLIYQVNRTPSDNNVLIRSGEAFGIGWSRNILYSGFNTLSRSVFWSSDLNGRSDNTDVIHRI